MITDMKINMDTSLGTVIIELYPDKSPKTIENFLGYVKEEFYDDTIFHRIIDNFMIQGGGYAHGMAQKKTRRPIENEANNSVRNARGTIAMARTSDPHSASSQFFINVADNDFLNYTAATPSGWGYCVFGRVLDGLNVIDRIKGVPTGSRLGFKDMPLSDVVIKSLRVIE